MNNRLERILSYIENGRGVIDVGTDHGDLPAELARRSYRGNILASDIKSGPLGAAVRTAKAAGVEERIQFLLCDGLSLCPPEAVDTIVIAGMGGDTICGILDRAEWCMDRQYTLILQPMTRPEVLRYWLVYNEFEITAEDLAQDGKELYQIFTARFGGVTRLSDAELFTGSYAMVRKNPLFPAFLRGQLRRFEKAEAGLRVAGRAPAGRLELIDTILGQLREMEKYENRSGNL